MLSDSIKLQVYDLLEYLFINHILYNKNFGGKKVWRISAVGSLVEKFGELKSICIRNAMEIVKIDEKQLGELLSFSKFTKVFLLPMFLTVWYVRS